MWLAIGKPCEGANLVKVCPYKLSLVFGDKLAQVSYYYDNCGMGSLHMSKAAALEEMYLIYRAFRNYLADAESWGEYGVEELATSFRSFCQREPIGGMFLESVLEELVDRARDGELV